MEIAYAIHTETCTFLLDDGGICRRVIARVGEGGVPDTAKQCLGAQYIASLDAAVDGYLVAEPRVGSPMLFGVVTPTGRIAVVRTGRILRFEDRRDLAARALETNLPDPDGQRVTSRITRRDRSQVRPRSNSAFFGERATPIPAAAAPIAYRDTVRAEARQGEDERAEQSYKTPVNPARLEDIPDALPSRSTLRPPPPVPAAPPSSPTARMAMYEPKPAPKRIHHLLVSRKAG
jgi:hypothetical protein